MPLGTPLRYYVIEQTKENGIKTLNLTIELSDDILATLKKVARYRGQTTKQLLTIVLTEQYHKQYPQLYAELLSYRQRLRERRKQLEELIVYRDQLKNMLLILEENNEI